jgi:hypothetical protein
VLANGADLARAAAADAGHRRLALTSTIARWHRRPGPGRPPPADGTWLRLLDQPAIGPPVQRSTASVGEGPEWSARSVRESPPPYEFSGVADAIGAGVDQLKPGAAVYALSSFDRGGATADYIALPAKYLAPRPNALDHVEAAAVPLAGLSACSGVLKSRRE